MGIPVPAFEFHAYAVDADGDAAGHLGQHPLDVLASTANHPDRVGWQPG
ncbi:hypothetical protein DSL92_05870 [Billgrantia gudaonensis]|uniref:Transglycosylase SLT domain-containing protein n=1 Tax=Billgrantia gudaonensis TaxID=376427 RepID=A0A432JJJ9_9GAMM|nr:hypothetical protein DSL92_05870 [Halomonas gudaonensis]